MLLSEIISKPVISINEGKIKGVISNAIFSNFLTKITAFQVVLQEDNNEEEEVFLNKDSIKCIGDDAIILKQNTVFSNEGTPICSPINGLAYSTTGKLLGKIINIEVDKNYNVITIVTQTQNLKPENLVSFSNGLYIFNTENKKTKRYSNEFIFPSKLPSIKVTSLPLIEEKKESVPFLPQKTVTNSEVLLGKRVSKTIQTPNGEIIAKMGCVITQKILLSATKNQKLRELAIYSE